MKLEKEISQKKFKDQRQKAAVNIIFTYSWIVGHLKKEFSQYDITMQQFNILRILRGQYPNPSTVNLLKERMLDKMCDVSRMIDRLKQKDLIERNVNKSDRRAVDIFISKKGLELLALIDQNYDPTHVVNNLNEDEAEELNLLLDKIRE